MSIKAVVTTVIGNAAYASIAGVTTYATTAGVSTYAITAGITSFTSSSGIATYAETSGIATYAPTAGIATYTELSGISTDVVGGVASVTQLSISGISTFSGNAFFGDNNILYFGNGNDFEIFHNGSNSTVANATGTLYLAGDSIHFIDYISNETYATFIKNESAGLYYDNVKKFATTGIGVTVFGSLESQELDVFGASNFYDSLVINNDVSISSPEPGTLTFETNTNERLRITPTGSVGIGTNVTNYTLSVTNTASPSISGLENCLFDATSNVNAYAQVNIHNLSPSEGASSDIVLTSNIGDDTSYYIDLGINNNGFSLEDWTINGANDGYLYASDGNFSIGVVGNKYLSFFTDGTLDSNERLRIASGGNVGIATTEPQAKLHVEGDVRVSGIITSTGGFTSGIGVTNSVQITVSGDLLTFTVVGVGSTTLQLF